MTILPISTTTPFRFSPLVDQIEKARDAVAEAERKDANAFAALEAKPTDEALRDAADEAKEALNAATDALDALESELAANPGQPVYLLRVPTYRTNAAFEEAMVALPTYPGDRRVVRAIEESGLISPKDSGLLEIKGALKKSGGGVPEELAGVFEDLYDRAVDAPEVGAIRAGRSRFLNAVRLLRVRHHLLGFEGLATNFIANVGGQPNDDTLDAIPPADVAAIAAKVEELNTLRGRLGNSRSAVKSSVSPPPSQPNPTDTASAETTEIQTAA